MLEALFGAETSYDFSFSKATETVSNSIKAVAALVVVVAVGIFAKVFLPEEELRVELDQELQEQRAATRDLLDEETVKVDCVREKALNSSPA